MLLLLVELFLLDRGRKEEKERREGALKSGGPKILELDGGTLL